MIYSFYPRVETREIVSADPFLRYILNVAGTLSKITTTKQKKNKTGNLSNGTQFS